MEKLSQKDVIYSTTLKTNIVFPETIFYSFFGVMFLIFSIIGFIAIDDIFSVGFFINSLFLVLAIIIISSLISNILAKPKLLLTQKHLYKIKRDRVEKYRLTGILHDIHITRNIIILRYRPSFSDFKFIRLCVDDSNRQQIESALYKAIVGNEKSSFTKITDPANEITSITSAPIIVTIGLSAIGIMWMLFSTIFIYFGFQELSVVNILVGFMGLGFFVFGGYFLVEYGVFQLLKTASTKYTLFTAGIYLENRKFTRFIAWKEVKSISAIKKVLNLQKLRITASTTIIKNRQNHVGSDHLFIYSKEDLSEFRKLLKLHHQNK